MRIAGIQISAGNDLERNIQRAVELAKVAADKDARIICYPELFLTPWFPRREDRSLLSWALDVASGHLELFRILSESTKTVLLVPFFEYTKDNYYNSTAVFDSGEILGTYRKLHVPKPTALP